MKETKQLQKRREAKKSVTLYYESSAPATSAAGKSHCIQRRC